MTIMRASLGPGFEKVWAIPRGAKTNDPALTRSESKR